LSPRAAKRRRHCGFAGDVDAESGASWSLHEPAPHGNSLRKQLIVNRFAISDKGNKAIDPRQRGPPHGSPVRKRRRAPPSSRCGIRLGGSDRGGFNARKPGLLRNIILSGATARRKAVVPRGVCRHMDKGQRFFDAAAAALTAARQTVRD
jgi:hypothetical protein